MMESDPNTKSRAWVCVVVLVIVVGAGALLLVFGSTLLKGYNEVSGGGERTSAGWIFLIVGGIIVIVGWIVANVVEGLAPAAGPAPDPQKQVDAASEVATGEPLDFETALKKPDAAVPILSPADAAQADAADPEKVIATETQAGHVEPAMNDSVVEKLRSALPAAGRVLPSQDQCERLLRQSCAGHKREFVVLAAALKAGVAGRLMRDGSSAISTSAADNYARGLRERYAISAPAARWAVTAWAGALGVEIEPKGGSNGARAVHQPLGMDAQVAKVLCDLSARKGADLLLNKGPLLGLLKDHCPHATRETAVLMLALEAEIPQRLRLVDAAPAGDAAAASAFSEAELRDELIRDQSLDSAASAWAIETWRQALRVMPAEAAR